MDDTTAQTVINFWFGTLTPNQWFAKDEAQDALIKQRFDPLLKAAIAGELWTWRRSPQGRLAEILVLDQFSRNIYRERAEAYGQDAQALVLAQEAVAAGADGHLEVRHRAFLYMPYMHSESLIIHEEALRLFDQPGLEESFRFERHHRAILARFGRYPHRNAALGRASTDEEIDFLKTPGSSF